MEANAKTELIHSNVLVPQVNVEADQFFVIGGSLESPYWLLLAFCPKILGGGGDLQMICLLLYE